MVALKIQRIPASRIRNQYSTAPALQSPAIDFLNSNPDRLASIPATFSQEKGVHYGSVWTPCLLTYIMFLLFPLTTGLMQWACIESLQESPGLWGANFTRVFLPALLCQYEIKEGTGSNTFSWWNFPLLPPNASNLQNKEQSKICTKTLQEITRWEGKEQISGPSQPWKIGTHIHQLLQSELALEAAKEESKFGSLLHSLGLSSPGCRALLSGALLDSSLFWPWLTAIKHINNAEGDPPACRKPLTAEYTLQQYAERSKTAPGQTVTSRKTCTQQNWGFYVLRSTSFHFIPITCM